MSRSSGPDAGQLEIELTRDIRHLERRFRALVEASRQIVWSTDHDGAVVEDSSAWRAFTGQAFDQFRDAGWLEAVHPEDRDAVARAWDEAVADRSELAIEFRLRHAPTGQWRWVSARSVPIREVDDPLLGRVGMIADIDERKRSEEKILALASNLALAEYEERRRIAHVLHDDLQQRLYSIRMKVGMLRCGDDNDSRFAEIEQLLTDSVDVTRALTVDLSPPILEGEGLVDAIDWLATQMGEMHDLRVDVQADEPFAMEDEDMRVFLFQIVRELLFNVVKHAGVDRATVSLEQVDGQLHIEVSDEGQGFQPDVAERSQGLGLSHVTERLTLFGGRMHIASEPGAGTSVEVTVPRAAQP